MGKNRYFGRTVLELLMIITVAEVVLALTVPATFNFLQGKRITRTAVELNTLITKARDLGVQEQQYVTLSYRRPNRADWDIALSLGQQGCNFSQEDPQAADFCGINGVEYRVRGTDHPSLELVEVRTDEWTHVVFDPQTGAVVNQSRDSRFNFVSLNSKYALAVKVRPTGGTVICLPDLSKPVEGFSGC